MEQKHSLETDVKEQKGEILYFPYGVPPGVPFFAEGWKAEEYPTVAVARFLKILQKGKIITS